MTTVQINSSIQIVFGVYLIIMGLVMIIFRKEVKQWNDDWYAHIPGIWLRPTGVFLTVMIIVFGTLSILVGVTLLLLAFVQTF